MSRVNAGVSRHYIALAALEVLGFVCACDTTLDPTILVLGGDAGRVGKAGPAGDARPAGDAGGGIDAARATDAGGHKSPLAMCSPFTDTTSDYLACSEPADLASAAADCARRGATLAAPRSAEQNEFIAAGAYAVLHGNLWLGGIRDDAFVWRWPDGTIFWRGGPDGAAENGAYAQWAPSEPNNSSTVTTEPERCLALTPEGHDWDDRACSLSLPYVCERPNKKP